MDLSDQRMSYEAEGIDLDAMHLDPIEQFGAWFVDAQQSGEPEPYAMVLSTADADGQPRGRAVLLRGVSSDGFVFYTNYSSRKAKALEHAGRAGLTFLWHSLHRQVHVSGTIERVSNAESDAYFAKRPRGSQLGAWASDQSAELASRAELIDRLEHVTMRFDGGDVPRPDFWGGYRVVPADIEFWQGQPSRLHDRVLYHRESATWTRTRLNP